MIKYLKLNNGVLMPLVGLGTWDLRNDECMRSVSTAIRLGYRLIDTAQMYGNEEDVGKGIADSGISRKELFITTKIYRINNSYEKAANSIDESLNRLGMEYVDLLLLHEPYKEESEMYRAIEDAYKMGKARAIGISNYNETLYKRFLSRCNIIPAVNQIENHVYYQKRDFQSKMLACGTHTQAWSPLAQGIYRIFENPLLNKIGKHYEKTAAQIALRFLTQQNIAVIPKSKSEERLKENLDIFDFNLTDEDMFYIRTLDRNDTLFPWTNLF